MAKKGRKRKEKDLAYYFADPDSPEPTEEEEAEAKEWADEVIDTHVSYSDSPHDPILVPVLKLLLQLPSQSAFVLQFSEEPDQEKWGKEIQRILKPGGKIIVKPFDAFTEEPNGKTNEDYYLSDSKDAFDRILLKKGNKNAKNKHENI